MRAFRLRAFGGIDDLVMTHEKVPQPVRGEALVRVRAVSLNYRDLAMANDQYPPPHLPGLVPVSDAAGEVVAVGDDTGQLKVGDRVISSFNPRWFGGGIPADFGMDQFGSHCDGWLTEFKTISCESLVRVPESLSFVEAATLPCAGLTAWNALRNGSPVGPGQTVLTLGTGGVSLFAVQLAIQSGAHVIATTSTETKAEALRKLGAHHVINYAEDPDWGVQARAWTGGRGVDRVVEVGGAGTFAQSMQAVARGGEIAVVGFLASSEKTTIDFNSFFLSGATSRVLHVGSRSSLIDLVSAVSQTGLQPVIDSVFPFEASVDAYRHLATASAVGKIVISL
jgi:alcohol dehydrogenase